MSGKTIATIYFYLISAVSLFLIVIGIFSVVTFIINSTEYDKYPLRYTQPDCEFSFNNYPYPAKPMSLDEKSSTSSAQDLAKQKQFCLNQQEIDRKQHRIEDLKNSLAFSLIGIVLFLIHFPQARKHSRS